MDQTFLAVCALAVACSGGMHPLDSITRVVPEPPGAHCAAGGSAIETGTDADGDGVLDANEVSATTYVCDGIGAMDPLVLPPLLYFAPGQHSAVYFDNMVLSQSAAAYAWDVLTPFGQHLESAWTWTPPAEPVSAAITFRAHAAATAIPLAEASTEASSSADAAGVGTQVTCLFIGDSLTNAGVYTQTLLDLAAADGVGLTLLGTRGTGANRHEGRPGWRIASFTSDCADTTGPNPFWNAGQIDFQGYLAANAAPAPDWVFVLLGTNDVFAAASDVEAETVAAEAFGRLDGLVASVLATGEGVRVGVMTPPPPTASQDVFAQTYGSGQTRWRFKRNILIWNRELIARYHGASRTFVVPTHLSIDTVAGMANGVHPNADGYRQIGGAVWAFLKSQP